MNPSHNADNGSAGRGPAGAIGSASHSFRGALPPASNELEKHAPNVSVKSAVHVLLSSIRAQVPTLAVSELASLKLSRKMLATNMELKQSITMPFIAIDNLDKHTLHLKCWMPHAPACSRRWLLDFDPLLPPRLLPRAV